MREIERTPLAANVGALLDDAVVRCGDRPFLVFFDDDDTLSYARTSPFWCAMRRVRSPRSGWAPAPASG